MTKDESAAIARQHKGKTRRRRRRKPLAVGDKLPLIDRAKGLVGVRKMAVKALQQQVEALRDRYLGPDDRDFLLKLVNTLVVGEKATKFAPKPSAPLNNDVDQPNPALPALEPRAPTKDGAQ